MNHINNSLFNNVEVKFYRNLEVFTEKFMFRNGVFSIDIVPHDLKIEQQSRDGLSYPP